MKRKLGGAIVKRCIVTAMTVMLVSNSGLTVRAEESVQVQEQQDVQEQVEVQAQQQDNAAGEDNQNTGDEAGEDMSLIHIYWKCHSQGQPGEKTADFSGNAVCKLYLLRNHYSRLWVTCQ